jgi:hypothetical protein
MRKTLLVKKLIYFGFLLTALFAIAWPGIAADFGINYAQNLQLANTNQDPRDATINIVRYLLTFIGLLAVIVIIYGVVGAVNAGGNEERAAFAKKTILAGVIGLVVVLAAFVIIQFVIGTTTNILANGNP